MEGGAGHCPCNPKSCCESGSSEAKADPAVSKQTNPTQNRLTHSATFPAVYIWISLQTASIVIHSLLQ
jgi:hypothetical protein